MICVFLIMILFGSVFVLIVGGLLVVYLMWCVLFVCMVLVGIVFVIFVLFMLFDFGCMLDDECGFGYFWLYVVFVFV